MAAKRGGGRIKTVVYLDVLLLTNFLLAYFQLLAAGALSGQRAGPLTASPTGGSQTKQKRPAAKYSGAQELMLFYLEAQPEQLAQEVQAGCSSSQIRSAEGVHWSA